MIVIVKCNDLKHLITQRKKFNKKNQEINLEDRTWFQYNGKNKTINKTIKKKTLKIHKKS